MCVSLFGGFMNRKFILLLVIVSLPYAIYIGLPRLVTLRNSAKTASSEVTASATTASSEVDSMTVAPVEPADRETAGLLQGFNSRGEPAGLCPLKHTDVKAEISGFISRVTVTQEFQNPFKEKIEAVYTFPLSQNGAVDDMTMHIGDRVVRAKIKPRDEARQIYEAARSAGNRASLLD